MYHIHPHTCAHMHTHMHAHTYMHANTGAHTRTQHAHRTCSSHSSVRVSRVGSVVLKMFGADLPHDNPKQCNRRSEVNCIRLLTLTARQQSKCKTPSAVSCASFDTPASPTRQRDKHSRSRRGKLNERPVSRRYVCLRLSTRRFVR